jgi:hypothetical protein
MIKYFVWKSKPEHSKDNHKSVVDIKNYGAVFFALTNFNEHDQDIILDVYSRADTIPDNIYQISKERNINQNEIWTLISKVSKEIAKERGLI